MPKFFPVFCAMLCLCSSTARASIATPVTSASNVVTIIPSAGINVPANVVSVNAPDFLFNVNADIVPAEPQPKAQIPVAPVAPVSADMESQITGEINRVSRSNFLRLYRSLWQSRDMEKKLSAAVDNAFADQTKNLTWGTAGLQLAVDKENIIEAIQEAAAFQFAHDYDEFMAALESAWNVALDNDIRAFYTGTVSRFLRTETNAVTLAWLRQDYEKIRTEQGSTVITALLSRLRNRHPEFASAASIGMTAGLAGLAGMFLRKRLSGFVMKRLGGQAASKLVAGAIPVVNAVMLVWGAWDLASVAWDAENTVHQELLNVNRELYAVKVPEAYWDEMQPYVKEIYLDAYEEIRARVELTKKVSDIPQVVELSQGMSDLEKQDFAERIVVVLREFGGISSDGVAATNLNSLKLKDELLRDFGTYIRDVSSADFQKLLAIFKSWPRQRIRAWFDLTDDTEFYGLYANLPASAWEKFPPTEESLDLLLWIARNLTPSAREIACEMPPTSIRWVIDELPVRHVSLLFSTRSNTSTKATAAAIESEIERLALLSNKENRHPWMSDWDYFMVRYRARFATGGGILLVAIVLCIWFRFKNAAALRRDRVFQDPLPSPSDLPLQMPDRTRLPFQYTVNLWIHHGIKSDLFDLREVNIQRLNINTDCRDDKDSYDEFAVYCNDLDALAQWVFQHQSNQKDSVRLTENTPDANVLRALLYDLSQGQGPTFASIKKISNDDTTNA